MKITKDSLELAKLEQELAEQPANTKEAKKLRRLIRLSKDEESE